MSTCRIEIVYIPLPTFYTKEGNKIMFCTCFTIVISTAQSCRRSHICRFDSRELLRCHPSIQVFFLSEL